MTKMRWSGRLGAALACLSIVPRIAGALPLISEVFYDASGSDDGRVFVELYGPPGTALDGWIVQGVNGSNGSVTPSLALSGTIPADGLFVVADELSGGGTEVANADLVLSFDFQNGPDSVELLAPDASIADAVGYGEFAPDEFFAGEGTPAPDVPAGSSLARVFADVDTDDNFADFAAAAPTPGSASLAVPEPATAALLGAGLAGLAGAGRRRRPRAGPSGGVVLPSPL